MVVWVDSSYATSGGCSALKFMHGYRKKLCEMLSRARSGFPIGRTGSRRTSSRYSSPRSGARDRQRDVWIRVFAIDYIRGYFENRRGRSKFKSSSCWRFQGFYNLCRLSLLLAKAIHMKQSLSSSYPLWSGVSLLCRVILMISSFWTTCATWTI